MLDTVNTLSLPLYIFLTITTSVQLFTKESAHKGNWESSQLLPKLLSTPTTQHIVHHTPPRKHPCNNATCKTSNHIHSLLPILPRHPHTITLLQSNATTRHHTHTLYVHAGTHPIPPQYARHPAPPPISTSSGVRDRSGKSTPLCPLLQIEIRTVCTSRFLTSPRRKPTTQLTLSFLI